MRLTTIPGGSDHPIDNSNMMPFIRSSSKKKSKASSDYETSCAAISPFKPLPEKKSRFSEMLDPHISAPEGHFDEEERIWAEDMERRRLGENGNSEIANSSLNNHGAKVESLRSRLHTPVSGIVKTSSWDVSSEPRAQRWSNEATVGYNKPLLVTLGRSSGSSSDAIPDAIFDGTRMPSSDTLATLSLNSPGFSPNSTLFGTSPSSTQALRGSLGSTKKENSPVTPLHRDSEDTGIDIGIFDGTQPLTATNLATQTAQQTTALCGSSCATVSSPRTPSITSSFSSESERSRTGRQAEYDLRSGRETERRCWSKDDWRSLRAPQQVGQFSHFDMMLSSEEEEEEDGAKLKGKLKKVVNRILRRKEGREVVRKERQPSMQEPRRVLYGSGEERDAGDAVKLYHRTFSGRNVPVVVREEEMGRGRLTIE